MIVYDYAWAYTYDALARVIGATRYVGLVPSGTAERSYAYGYDVAGNRTNETINGVTTTRTYDAANRTSSAGFSYDAAGRLISDGTNTYTWDRASRLLSMGTSVSR